MKGMNVRQYLREQERCEDGQSLYGYGSYCKYFHQCLFIAHMPHAIPNMFVGNTKAVSKCLETTMKR